MALSKKTKRWLKNNSLQSFAGKTVLITGATSGVGFKTAEIMAFLGARVIMACRNMQKAQSVKETLLKEYPSAEIGILRLDLADLSVIDGFVSEIMSKKTDIDVFLNNAGVFKKPGVVTADGLDMVLGTNYFGVYYLSEKILPYLETLPHEVLYINTVSIIHRIATLDYSDFFCQKTNNSLSVYARSKLCLAKYTFALAKRYENTNIRILMNHPGIAITPLGLNAFGDTVKRLGKVLHGIFNSPEKSALSLPFIMSNSVPAGSIIGPDKFFGGWGYPKPNKIKKRVKTGWETLADFTQKQLQKVSMHK